MSKVMRSGEPPSVEWLWAEVRRLSADSANLQFSPVHFRDRLRARNITIRQVLETLRQGEPVGVPRQDEFGDWRLKLKRYVAGRKVQVVVAVQAEALVMITVM